MNENYKELYARFDGLTEDALKKCIEYANKEIIAGAESPAHTMYMAFEVYKRARLLEDKSRDISKEIYRDPLPVKMRYDFWQFITLLDPKVKEICEKEYGNRSPYAEKEAEIWQAKQNWS